MKASGAGKDAVSLAATLRVWLTIGLINFGGPAGQIALMHRVLVEERKWLGERQFLNALNYCMLLPGPEAQQLATYAGWLMHGVRGGLIAGTLFVLPGALVLLILSAVYALYGQTAFVAALFFGIKAAVLVIVVEALIRISGRILGGPALPVIAGLAFVLIFFLGVPFPVIVVGAGVAGYVLGRTAPGLLGVETEEPSGVVQEPAPSLRRAAGLIVIFLAAWFAPVVLIGLLGGTDSVFFAEGLFFSKMAVVTFGGAYAALAYVAQQAVESYGWLAPGEMLDGLGLAETTPGPLILVLQFVGFLAAFRESVALDPLLAGTLGSALVLWVTFVPCFLWIFLGAPYIERLAGNRALSAALTAITAAVAGVILNLAVWFALHVLFATVEERHWGLISAYVPDPASLDRAALGLALLAAIAVFGLRAGLVPVLAGAAALGLVVRWSGWAA